MYKSQENVFNDAFETQSSIYDGTWSFSKIVNGWKPRTIFRKSSIIDVCEGSKYTPSIQFSIKFTKALWSSNKTTEVENSLTALYLVKASWIHIIHYRGNRNIFFWLHYIVRRLVRLLTNKRKVVSFKKKDFIIHSLAFSLNKNGKEISQRSHSLFIKKKTTAKEMGN